jgi:hypothetical protein
MKQDERAVPNRADGLCGKRFSRIGGIKVPPGNRHSGRLDPLMIAAAKMEDPARSARFDQGHGGGGVTWTGLHQAEAGASGRRCRGLSGRIARQA